MNNPYSSNSTEALDSDYDSPNAGDTIMQRSPIAEDAQPQTAGTMSVLGPSLAFKGELVAGEDLLILGRVEGSIKHTAQNLTIGPEGSVKANIRARAIVVQGTVQGDVYASEVVTVESTAKVRGNIFAPRVGLHEGATFKGSIDMDVTEGTVAAKEKSPKASKKPAAKRRTKSKTELEGPEIDKILK